MTRSGRILPLTVVALTVVAALALDAPAALAAPCGGTQGTALLLGCDNNTETDAAVINTSTAGTVGLFVRSSAYDAVDTVGGIDGMFTRGGQFGVDAIGGTYGVRGSGGPYGVFGDGTTYGVYGSGSWYGVFGVSNRGCSLGGCGVGAWGKNTAAGLGVYGSSTDGTGVLGYSSNSIGVSASSTKGTALSVSGKARFSRSGTAMVAGTGSSPTNMVFVSLPVTAKSMMTATLQKYVPGVFVVAAVLKPGKVAGSYVGFTIYLNSQVTTSVGPIAWQVIEHP